MFTGLLLTIVKFDESFALFLYQLRTPFLAQVFYIITNFADQITIIILSAIAFLYLYFKKELAYLSALVLIFLGTETSVYLIKILINRPRPIADIAYYIETSGSFPSGHSALAVAFFGFVTYYLVRHITGRNKRFFVILLGIVLIVLIGFSRLYLGVHYVSDVLGGFLIGGLWLVIGITFRGYYFYIASLKEGENEFN
jgi:undecaprenyl-diphosphatase